MEDKKKRNATNDDINLQSDNLIDLSLADEQADQTRGGPSTSVRIKTYIAPSDPSTH
jgi:hypothetical protein